MTPPTQNLAADGTCSITICRNPADLKRFEELPERIHGKEPCFTPPFPGSVVKLIGPEGTFCRKHGEIHPLIAVRNGVPVGRIAAIVNRTHNAFSNDSVGFFGFFDCVNDSSVATALVEAAAAILRARGLSSIRGPYNPSINDDCGVLLKGNDRTSFVSMPWNPSWYGQLLETTGLEQVRTLYAWDVPVDKPLPERITRIVQRIMSRGKVTVRSIDLARMDEELEVIHRLYNLFEDRNWGFYPVALEDLLSAAEDLRSIANPELIRFVCVDGKEVAFVLALPNINEIFHAARGRKGWLRILEIGLRLKFQHITSTRLCLLGIEPAYRDKGLSALLFYESFVSTGRYHALTEVSWVEANNEEILEGAAIMGGYRSRTYGIYEKPLDHALPALLRSQVIILGSDVWGHSDYDGFFRVLAEALRREKAVLSMSGRQFDDLCRTQAPDSCALRRVEEFHRNGLLAISRVDLRPGEPSPSEPELPEQVLSLLAENMGVTLITDDAGMRIRLRESAPVTDHLLMAAGSDFRA